MSKEPKRPGHQARLAPSGQHALVVDDNEINRMILCEMLCNAGFSVEEAADGYEAIDRVLETQFDIAFLDISLPGIDGIETLKRIRRLDVAWRDLPAIAVTAHAARRDHDAIRKAPFSEILVKPVRPIDIQIKVFPVLGFFEAAAPSVSEDSGGDFKAQFGAQIYESALKEFELGLDHFFGQLRDTSEPTAEIRRVAHKLSGSAAVLGINEIHAQLQRIEFCDTEEWDELKKDLE